MNADAGFPPSPLRGEGRGEEQKSLQTGVETKPRLCLAKYPAMFAGKYRQKCPEPCARLCRDACLCLYLYLYLNLNPGLFAELNREKFEKSFHKKYQKSFAMLFRKLFKLKYRQF
jgi:hypothetical protein